MTDDFKKGLVTGLAMQPLYVSGSPYKFGTHNLLADCAFSAPFTVKISGERVLVDVPANLSVAWYLLESTGILFKYTHMYNLVVRQKPGYGRIGLSTRGGNPYTFANTHASGTTGDNNLVGQDSLESYFYVNMSGASNETNAGQLWFCSDAARPENYRPAFTMDIALYEEVKA